MAEIDPLLNWYFQNGRDLPWRRAKPDPYHILLSEVMLQQTTVAAVKPYFLDFIQKWPRLMDLARANDEEVFRAWAGLGYYSRVRNLLKSVREINKRGSFPNTSQELGTLPGIGPYTSAAIAAIAFGEKIIPRDGNINRILARYFAIEDPINRRSPALEHAAKEWQDERRSGDVAQALMDLGAGVCRSRNPRCPECPLSGKCQANVKDLVSQLPNRIKAKPKKILFAHCFILSNKAGQIGFVKREEKGLLGGMWALPTSEWTNPLPAFSPPAKGEWTALGGVRHIFTHIDLRLEIWHAEGDGPLCFFGGNNLRPHDLPKLWTKALNLYKTQAMKSPHVQDYHEVISA